MTSAELLLATGMIWRVTCYRDGNMRRPLGVRFVRAAMVELAERITRQVSGARATLASPWDPRRDVACTGWVRQVA